MKDWKSVEPWLVGAGMTPEEIAAFHLVTETATSVLKLDSIDPIDREDLTRAFHTVQTILLVRPQRRVLDVKPLKPGKRKTKR